MAANPTQLNNLTTLIKRLEAATSRLEDLAAIPGPPSNTAAPISSTASAASTIKNFPPPPPAEPLPPSIEDFDELIATAVAKYVEKSKGVDALIAEQSKAVEKCFSAQRKFLLITTIAKKPDGSKLFMDLLTVMQREWANVSNIFESNRASPFAIHLSAVSDGISSLAWVTEPKPANYVKDMLPAAQYFGDRVIAQYREKDPKHVEWIRSFYTVITSLEEYTRKHYATGLTWNINGIDAKDALLNFNCSAPPFVISPPPTLQLAPPPPPPPPPPPMPLDGASSPAGGPVGSVFAAINRGSDVTASLRKVDKSEMTHKNPKLRAGSVVPARPSSSGSLRAKSPAPPSKTKPAHLTKKRPPKKELDGNKWIIENYENEPELVLDDVEIHQSVFIFRCKNTNIKINGKINAVSISECVKTGVVVHNLVSSIDIIKSNSFALQIVGKAPTVQIDQCDGGTIYVSKESPDLEVLTSKATAININIPGEGEEWDYDERAVPEQLKHTIKGGRLMSEIVEHAG